MATEYNPLTYDEEGIRRLERLEAFLSAYGPIPDPKDEYGVVSSLTVEALADIFCWLRLRKEDVNRTINRARILYHASIPKLPSL